ncbi:uncharacterized protein LOC107765309 [Nicotiana tabacum]|uniref:Uncharacterized protein LOC107765309 n=2 Tax=Nicotiana TaxID=4085 RepID=A0A1S3XHM0_TOBAC|nr:PREDICTED: uncharacterized protein LOC104243020 [Nicotiana sylvestris]XP_016439421.1 PREDICTED: uncharacterized protein LOC107765309 [Nicotiana tabacum]
MEWSPQQAMEAYLNTLQLSKTLHDQDCTNIKATKRIEPECVEFISALAAGNRSKVILEISTEGLTPFTIALAVAAKLTGGRLVCVLPHHREDMIKTSNNFELKPHHQELNNVIEFVVGKNPNEVIKKFKKVDFLVIDCKFGDHLKLWKNNLEVNPKGCVVVTRNNDVVGSTKKVCFGEIWKGKKGIECVTMPIGEGIELTKIKSSSCKKESRRFKRFHVTFEN